MDFCTEFASDLSDEDLEIISAIINELKEE